MGNDVDGELYPTLESGGRLVLALLTKENLIPVFSNMVMVNALRGRWVLSRRSQQRHREAGVWGRRPWT